MVTRDEAIGLARVVRAMRPQQVWDSATPQAWWMALDDVPLADAEEAVRTLAKSAPYIDPPAIRAGVKRLRDDRLARIPIPAYPGDPDDVAAEMAWKRDWTRRIGDGENPATSVAQVETRPMPRLDGVFKRPPRGEEGKKS